jgi:hypothetical protein
MRLLPVVLLVACGSTSPVSSVPGISEPAATWSYRIEVTDAVRTAAVEMCFPAGSPVTIRPGSDDALAYVTEFQVAGRPVRPASRIHLPSGGCARYVVDLAAAARSSGWRMRALTPSPVRVVRPAALLWEPTRSVEAPRVSATSANRFSCPWAATDGRMTLPPSTFRTSGRLVFGAIELRSQQVAGATLEAALLGDSLPGRSLAVDSLLADAMRGVATVFGGVFPRSKLQALVLPQPGGSIGFGEAERGGGGAVMVMVGERARYSAVKTDWTAVHEVFHVVMPQTIRGNAWFSEGVASYYQYLLLARVGLLDPVTAWSSLHAGFGRGRSDDTGRTLDEDSEGLGRYSAYWRVYWTGAAWAFRADVELRRRGRSLDEVVAFWRKCCPDETSWWNARPLLRQADTWLGEPLLDDLADAALPRRDFPELADLYAALGIVVVDGKTVRLNDEAPEAKIRRAITARR